MSCRCRPRGYLLPLVIALGAAALWLAMARHSTADEVLRCSSDGHCVKVSHSHGSPPRPKKKKDEDNRQEDREQGCEYARECLTEQDILNLQGKEYTGAQKPVQEYTREHPDVQCPLGYHRPTRDTGCIKTKDPEPPQPTPRPKKREDDDDDDGPRTVLVPPPPVEKVLVPPPPPVQWDAQDVQGAPVITGRLVQRADRLLMTAQGGRAADTRYNLTWARPHTVFTHPETGAQWFVARPVRRIAVGACPARMSAGSDCRRLRSRYTLLAPSAVAGWPGAAAALGRAADRAARSALGIDLGRIPPGDAATAYCSTTAPPPPLQAAHRTLADLLDGEEGAPGQWDGGLQMTLAALPADVCAPDMPPAGHTLTEADTLTAFPPAMQVVIWAGTVARGE